MTTTCMLKVYSLIRLSLFWWAVYFGGLSLFWWVICILVGCLYSGGLSWFCWGVFILKTCLYSAELSTEIDDYFFDWLQIVRPLFAQQTSKHFFYWVIMSNLDNMTCHRSFIAYCSWCDKMVATILYDYKLCPVFYACHMWAHFLFIFIAMEWDHKIDSLICVYVLIVNNPTSM